MKVNIESRMEIEMDIESLEWNTNRNRDRTMIESRIEISLLEMESYEWNCNKLEMESLKWKKL